MQRLPLDLAQLSSIACWPQHSSTLDRLEEAQQVADPFLAAQAMTVSGISEMLSIIARSYIDRFAKGMRRAGIPEELWGRSVQSANQASLTWKRWLPL
ncbi:MAG: hypothetical protein DI537_06285 [Stutzerimonas stutzeri]|nr:MAG: hypothetical protein DI537_06285 [Stutzerimonas stutzeri]